MKTTKHIIMLMALMHSVTLVPMNNEDSPIENTKALIEWAKKKGFDMPKFLSEADEENNTLLHYAAELLDIDEAQLLLDHGADINAKGGPNRDKRPLDLATIACREKPEQARDMIKFLCMHGAEVTQRMTHRLLTIRMYNPENSEIISECLELIHAKSKA